MIIRSGIFDNNLIEDIEEDIYNNNMYDNALIKENDNLRKHMTEMIKKYPKKEIFKKLITDKCPICLEKYEYEDDIILTNCYHLFHQKCIDNSIENNIITCPSCRYDFTNSVFLYLKFKVEITKTDFLN